VLPNDVIERHVLARGLPEPVQPSPIHIGVAPLLIERREEVADALQDGLCLSMGLTDLLLRPLALVDFALVREVSGDLVPPSTVFSVSTASEARILPCTLRSVMHDHIKTSWTIAPYSSRTREELQVMNRRGRSDSAYKNTSSAISSPDVIERTADHSRCSY